uniref:Uncharacterized protein n=1 Tax=Plectus sambesii TaxID=2011161 RepID=A0A914WHE9_9BILA
MPSLDEMDEPAPISERRGSRSLLIDSLVVTSSSLSPPPTDIVCRLYKRRWYLLAVFSFSSFVQGYLYNNYGPIFASMQKAFGWTEGTLSVAIFSVLIVGAVLQVPSVTLLERYGLKTTVVWMSVLLVLSTAVRCVPVTGELLTTLVVIGCILTSIGGAVTYILPPYISARWFGPTERRFVTAISLGSNSLGTAAAFVIGPKFFEMPEHSTIHEVQQRYYDYCYWQFAVTFIILIVTIATFPREAKLPPSVSAVIARTDMKEALPALLRSRGFWLVTICWTLTNGTFSGWLPVLSVDLVQVGIDQDRAGPIGFVVSVIGGALGVGLGLMADKCGHLKAVLIALCVLAIEGSVWLLLLTRGVLPMSLAQMYWATVLLGGATSAITPIAFELVADISFPVDEAAAVGVSATLGSIYCSIFVLGLKLPIGTWWMDWFLVIACVAALPFALGVTESLHRSQVDQTEQDNDSNCDIIHRIR